MSRSIAIHWEHDFVRLAVADEQDPIHLHELVRLPLDPGTGFDGAAEAIGRYVSDHGLTRREATVIVSRGQLELRVIELPPAPDDELPDMVRFQAKSHFSSMPEGQPIDFIRLVNGKDAPRVYVLAATMDGDELESIQRAVEGARLRVRHVMPRAFAAVNLLRRELTQPKYVLIVNRFAEEADLTVAYRNRILLTRTVRLPHDAQEQNTALIVELRRTIAAASNQPSGGPVTRALILGNTTLLSELAARVEKELDVPTQVIGIRELIGCSGPAAKILADDDGSFAAVVGGLGLSATPSEHLIDFANPHRRPEPVKDPRRKYVISGIAAAAVLFVVITILVLFGQRRAEVNRLQAEFDRLSQNAEARDLLIGKVDLIDRWKRGDVNWLEELLEISNRFPLPDEAIVGGFTASAGGTSDEASITISGMISEPRVENDIVNELRDRPYVVSQGKSSPVGDHKLFNRSFDLRLGIPLAGRNVDQLLGIGNSAAIAEGDDSSNATPTPSAASSDSVQKP